MNKLFKGFVKGVYGIGFFEWGFGLLMLVRKCRGSMGSCWMEGGRGWGREDSFFKEVF